MEFRVKRAPRIDAEITVPGDKSISHRAVIIAALSNGVCVLRGFLAKLPEHLTPGGEGWLVLSDLAEHLNLRIRAQLLAEFDIAGLRVLARHDVPPRHPRAADKTDALHHARAAEVTSLWRLAAQR